MRSRHFSIDGFAEQIRKENNMSYFFDDFNLELSDLISKLEEYRSDYPETYEMLDSCCELTDYEDIFSFIVELAGCEPAIPIQKDVATFMENVLLELAENEDISRAIRGEAANELGTLYYDGRIGEKSFDKATELYEYAASLGNAHAQENLGYVWYYGRTGKIDYEMAFNCFIKGALNGRPISMYKIGDMYKNGYYVKKDPVQAFNVFNAAQDLMTNDENIYTAWPDVSMRLADCYFEGFGTEQDYAAALTFYQQAERLYYHRIRNGDYFYRESLKHVIVNEQLCRQKIMIDLPNFEWTESN